MKTTLFQKDNLKHLSMRQLKEIKDNGYRSKDCRQDYCPFSVEERIFELAIKQADALCGPTEPVIEFDNQLSAEMSVKMPGKWLLSLIDYAVKKHKKFTHRIELKQKNINFTIDCDLFPTIVSIELWVKSMNDWIFIRGDDLTINQHADLTEEVIEWLADNPKIKEYNPEDYI